MTETTADPPQFRPVDGLRFIRFFALGCSVGHVLVGMALAGVRINGATMTWAIITGILFHLFAFVGNDVCDLAMDRTDPRRSNSPLVRAMVKPGTALGVAMTALLAFLVITAYVESLWAGLIAAAALATYNLWGKRSRFPIGLELIQAIGWASLLLVGANWGNSNGSDLKWWGAGYVVAFIMLTNAAHGGLRDLANDAAHGARTTPRLLGSEITLDGLQPGRAMTRYVVSLEVLLSLLMVGLVAAAWSRGAMMLLVAAVAAHLLVLSLGWAAWQALPDRERMLQLGTVHLFGSGLIPVLAAAALVSTPTAVALVSAYVLPPALTMVLER